MICDLHSYSQQAVKYLRLGVYGMKFNQDTLTYTNLDT